MVLLLSHYSLDDTILFIVLLALAFKGVFTFLSWAGDLLKQMVHKAETPLKLELIIETQKEEIDGMKECLNKLNDSVHLLINSDKDSIKAYITRLHHYFVYEQKWIDDYSLDCIERRFVHYLLEGGNTFILELMLELRALPKQPLKEKEDNVWQND